MCSSHSFHGKDNTIVTLHYHWPMSVACVTGLQHIQCTDSIIMPVFYVCQSRFARCVQCRLTHQTLVAAIDGDGDLYMILYNRLWWITTIQSTRRGACLPTVGCYLASTAIRLYGGGHAITPAGPPIGAVGRWAQAT